MNGTKLTGVIGHVNKSAVQKQSNKMKELYAENKIFNRLVLRKNEKGEWYFSTERLTEEEMKYIHKTWCNGSE